MYRINQIKKNHSENQFYFSLFRDVMKKINTTHTSKMFQTFKEDLKKYDIRGDGNSFIYYKKKI